MLAAYGLNFVQFDADPNLYFSEDNPHFQRIKEMQHDYGRVNTVTFVILIKEGELFTRENLAIVEELTFEAGKLPYSQRVDSLSNYTYTWSKNDELFVEELIQDAKNLSDEQIQKIKHFALTDAATVNRLASYHGEVALVNLLARFPTEDRINSELYLAREARKLAALLEKKYPHIDILMTGKVITNATVNNTVYKDTVILIPLMFLVIFGMLIIFLQSFLSVLAIGIVTISACISAIGLAAHFGTIMNLLSFTSINIIITISIAHCVHIIVCFLQAYRQGQSKLNALAESYRINLQPIFITSLTTILGFLSMNLSDMPPAHDLGNITALGVFIVTVLSLTMLPALIMMLPISNTNKKKTSISHSNMDIFSDFLVRNHYQILIGSILISTIMLILSTQNIINDSFTENLKKPSQVRLDNEVIDHYFGGFYNIEYSFKADKNSSISDPKYLHALDDFTLWLRNQPEVKNVYSYSDVIKRLNKNMHGDNPDFYRIPDTQEEAAQYLLLLEMSQPADSGMSHYILPDKTATKLIVALPSIDSLQMIELTNRFQQQITKTLPEHMFYPGSGLSVMWAYLGGEVLTSSIKGSLFALLLISIILTFIFKSIRYGIISIIPNIFPMGIGYGIWYLYNGFLDTSQMMVLCITIGIIVDDTVHFISKYLRGRRELNYNSEDAIRYTFHRIGAPLWITTAVLVSGFSILMFSSFTPNSNLGILTAIILLAALTLDFLLLPSLLLWLDKTKNKPSNIT